MNILYATEVAYNNGYANGKADAVREFAERLKKAAVYSVCGEYCVSTTVIDLAASEVLEGGSRDKA
jgi:hypothetical protein